MQLSNSERSILSDFQKRVKQSEQSIRNLQYSVESLSKDVEPVLQQPQQQQYANPGKKSNQNLVVINSNNSPSKQQSLQEAPSLIQLYQQQQQLQKGHNNSNSQIQQQQNTTVKMQSHQNSMFLEQSSQQLNAPKSRCIFTLNYDDNNNSQTDSLQNSRNIIEDSKKFLTNNIKPVITSSNSAKQQQQSSSSPSNLLLKSSNFLMLQHQSQQQQQLQPQQQQFQTSSNLAIKNYLEKKSLQSSLNNNINNNNYSSTNNSNEIFSKSVMPSQTLNCEELVVGPSQDIFIYGSQSQNSPQKQLSPNIKNHQILQQQQQQQQQQNTQRQKTQQQHHIIKTQPSDEDSQASLKYSNELQNTINIMDLNQKQQIMQRQDLQHQTISVHEFQTQTKKPQQYNNNNKLMINSSGRNSNNVNNNNINNSFDDIKIIKATVKQIQSCSNQTSACNSLRFVEKENQENINILQYNQNSRIKIKGVREYEKIQQQKNSRVNYTTYERRKSNTPLKENVCLSNNNNNNNNNQYNNSNMQTITQQNTTIENQNIRRNLNLETIKPKRHKNYCSNSSKHSNANPLNSIANNNHNNKNLSNIYTATFCGNSKSQCLDDCNQDSDVTAKSKNQVLHKSMICSSAHTNKYSSENKNHQPKFKESFQNYKHNNNKHSNEEKLYLSALEKIKTKCSNKNYLVYIMENHAVCCSHFRKDIQGLFP